MNNSLKEYRIRPVSKDGNRNGTYWNLEETHTGPFNTNHKYHKIKQVRLQDLYVFNTTLTQPKPMMIKSHNYCHEIIIH